jgi:hypothetical protein
MFFNNTSSAEIFHELNKQCTGGGALTGKSAVDDMFPMAPGITIDGHGHDEDSDESYENVI